MFLFYADNMHLMTDGNLQLIVECCDYFWSGEELAGMNETV